MTLRRYRLIGHRLWQRNRKKHRHMSEPPIDRIARRHPPRIGGVVRLPGRLATARMLHSVAAQHFAAMAENVQRLIGDRNAGCALGNVVETETSRKLCPLRGNDFKVVNLPEELAIAIPKADVLFTEDMLYVGKTGGQEALKNAVRL